MSDKDRPNILAQPEGKEIDLSLYERLAPRVGMRPRSAYFDRLIKEALSGKLVIIPGIQNLMPPRPPATAQTNELNEHLMHYGLGNIHDALDLCSTLYPTRLLVPGRVFHNPGPASASQIQALPASGGLVVVGSRTEIITGIDKDVKEQVDPADLYRQVWIGLDDEYGLLPAYQRIMAPAQPPIARTEASYICHDFAILPGLIIPQPPELGF